MPGILDVQDPYGGTPQDYERALDLIEAGCKGLLKALTPEARKQAG
jgi:protein-tyrosine-phosphatase